jgi:hypothetical protein
MGRGDGGVINMTDSLLRMYGVWAADEGTLPCARTSLTVTAELGVHVAPLLPGPMIRHSNSHEFLYIITPLLLSHSHHLGHVVTSADKARHGKLESRYIFWSW